MLYLAFEYGGDSLISKVIRWRTNSEFSHVELVLDLDKCKCFSAQINEGLRYRDVSWLKDERYWKLVPLRFVDEAAIRAEVERLAASGAEYDLRGIVNFFAGKRQTDETRWFCSEVCTHLAQVGGAFTWVKDCGISPAALCSMALARDEVVSRYLATQSA